MLGEVKCVPLPRRVVSWGVVTKGQDSNFFLNHWVFGNCNVSLENFCTFSVGKDKSFELYQKIFELGPPTIQVPQCPLLLDIFKIFVSVLPVVWALLLDISDVQRPFPPLDSSAEQNKTL